MVFSKLKKWIVRKDSFTQQNEVLPTITASSSEKQAPSPPLPIRRPSLVSSSGQSVTSLPEYGDTSYEEWEEYAADIIFRYTLDGQLVYVSSACRDLLGYEPQDLVPGRFYRFVHPTDEARLKDTHAALKSRSSATIVTFRMRHKAGHYIWLETSINMMPQPRTDGGPDLVAIARDVTERKRNEAEIQARSHQLTMFQSAGAAITSSLDLRFVLNTVAQQMVMMFQLESCVISQWHQSENTLVQMAGFGASGWWNPGTTEKKWRLADFPLTHQVLEEQIPEQLVVSQPNIDPSEHNYMRAAHIKTRLIVPMVFQQQVIGLVELEDTRFEREFSYQEVSMAKLLSNQAASAIENARLFQSARQEIKERRRAEEALEEERALLAQRVRNRTAELSRINAELSKAVRLKDEFLASMSHELRTPLNAILGSAEILKTGVFGELNDRQLKYSLNIEESGSHLLALINDILDLSKMEAGMMKLEMGPVSVSSVCYSSLRMIKQLAHKKNIRVECNIDEKTQSFLGDQRRIKQILVNLLSNAVKFTPAGKEIGLTVTGDAASQAIHFTVWDTGIGISEDNMDLLFKPFVQIDSKLSRQYAGTGLGLSLVSRMVEIHGGGVMVESKLNQGSRFTVSFPWQSSMVIPDKGKPEPLPENIEIPARDTPPLILLAEDNELTINSLVDYLETLGYQIIVARNGYEALERVQDDPPDIILMDIQMPEMDGLTAIRRLRTKYPEVATPVIVISALAMPGDKERCLQAGADVYMSKPLSLNNLVLTIEHYLNLTQKH